MVLSGGGDYSRLGISPLFYLCKALVFGGIEEIGWRYFFQPALQEKLTYLVSTLFTFLAWSLWHITLFLH